MDQQDSPIACNQPRCPKGIRRILALVFVLALLWLPTRSHGQSDGPTTGANEAEAKAGVLYRSLYENQFDDPETIDPLYPRFKSMEVTGGVLQVQHQKGHAASPTLPIPFTDGVFQFRFQLQGADRLVCRFEEKSRLKNAHAHLCRLEVKAQSASLKLDQPPKDRGRREPKLFATHRQDFSNNSWHQVQVVFRDQSMSVQIDGQEVLQGRHNHLAEEKTGVIFVVQKGRVLLDDFVLSVPETIPSEKMAVSQTVESQANGNSERGLKLFHDTIEPMLKQHCYECHSHEYEEASGGLVVDSRAAMLSGGDLGPSLVPGDPAGSLLMRALSYEDSALQMPPDGKLDAQTLSSVREWIELGAADPRASIVEDQPTVSGPDASKLWSVQPLMQSVPPETRDQTWHRNPIDRFVLGDLESAGLSPSPDATPDELVRRLHYVLIGLPPTIHESRSFVAAAKDDLDRALEQRIDELMQRQQFGERWGRHWLDVARYADASGTTAPKPFKQAWRYRDYVIHAFNSDKPWHEFVREQIAGDLIETESAVDRVENLIATGFFALSHVIAATRDPETLKLDTMDEQLDVFGKSFLGVSIGCARCHDHKLDPFPTREYYALAGVLRSTASYKPSKSQESLTLDGAQLSELKGDVAPWLMGGKGVRIHSVREADQARDEPIHLRGEVEITGEVVPRGFPVFAGTIQPPAIPSDSSGRLQLAQWILDPEQSLAWRVIVNRVWHHAFGQGIVRSTDNFGFTGDPPSHPELLDHLVTRFRDDHNGSFKSLIRELLTSRTWRQSSQLRDEGMVVDPSNRLLWRANPRRMEAEAVVDSIQFVCGQIDLSPAQETVPTFKVGNQGSTSDLQIPNEVLNRRAVYWPVFRKDVPIAMDVLGIFDFPAATTPRGTREVTRVPAQSLALLNNPFVIDSARVLSRTMLSDSSLNTDRERLRVLYQRLYCRAPSPSEERRALEFLAQFAKELARTQSARPEAVQSVCWNRLCHTLLVSNEFIVIP